MIRRLAQRIVHVLTLQCADHRRLQAMQLDGTLSWTDHLAMWGHWIACAPCRTLVRQLKAVEKAASQLGADTVSEVDNWKLSDQARARILGAMDRSDEGENSQSSG